MTVAWKPKADDKSVSPNKDDVKTASPKKEGRIQIGSKKEDTHLPGDFIDFGQVDALQN